jgi:glucose/arabinose dehydrogenase
MRGLSAGISFGLLAIATSFSSLLVLSSSFAQDATRVETRVESDQTDAKPYNLKTVVEGLVLPWSIAFLPNGDMLVTELDGRLRLIRNGELVREPVSGVPPVYRAGQGGLMDIALHPDFESNQWVYLTLATGTPERNALRVIRGRFTGSALEDIQTIFEAAKAKDTAVHYGARMTFLPDNTLLVAVGDGFNYREEAQNLTNHFGTIIRVTDNGKVPDDNPYLENDDFQPEIWSYGHRNQQGIVYDKVRGVTFETEHGPLGGDELNIIQPGLNYGWPAITYGRDYSGGSISPYTAYEGMEQPLVYWTPSIGPSGMDVYNGSAFSDWKGDIFISSLIFNHVVRVDMQGNEAGQQEILFAEIGDRIRDIRAAADGTLYLLVEGENGRIVRVSPAQ